MGAKIREQRFRAGDYLELNICPVFECRRSDGRRRRASQGLDKAKYVKIIERGSRSGRYHIHLVISGEGITPALIAELWGKGYVDCKPLQFSADGLKGLARYFTKDKQEGGDKEGSCRHSWSCSRNCVRPQPRTNDHKFSKKAVRSMVEEDAAEKVLRAMHPDYILADCETYYRDETGLYYIYAIMYRKDTKLNI